MRIYKLNQIVSLINQCKFYNKNSFYILKTPELLVIINILQELNCIHFYKLVKKSNNLVYYKIFVNIFGNFELFTLLTNFQQRFLSAFDIKKLLNSNLRIKFYFNTKIGVLTGSCAISRNCGGLLLFGIKYF